MLQITIIIFREVLEIALVISILVAATNGVQGRNRWILAGIGLGIFGASLLAFTELLKTKNFSLVALDSSGTNAFFVNNLFSKNFEILCPIENFISVGRFYNKEKKEEIFKNIKNSTLIVEV